MQQMSLNFFFNFLIFIFGCIGFSLLHMGFLQLRQAGPTLRCGAWTSHCGGFPCCRARAPGARASVVVARGLSSCGAWAQLLRSMWDLPRSGIEPVSPALAGGFLIIVPPGKLPLNFFKLSCVLCELLQVAVCFLPTSLK